MTDHADLPVTDRAYLDDMRGFVGDETLISLIDCAGTSLRGDLASLAAAAASGDLTEVREAAHRLKGAAGSIGATRLAAMAQSCQAGPELVVADPATLAGLETALDDADAALVLYRGSLTPVPPNPQ
jgi:HPt (histidine-containing phosphotransfer) domain-containing protein